MTTSNAQGIDLQPDGLGGALVERLDRCRCEPVRSVERIECWADSVQAIGIGSDADRAGAAGDLADKSLVEPGTDAEERFRGIGYVFDVLGDRGDPNGDLRPVERHARVVEDPIAGVPGTAGAEPQLAPHPETEHVGGRLVDRHRVGRSRRLPGDRHCGALLPGGARESEAERALRLGLRCDRPVHLVRHRLDPRDGRSLVDQGDALVHSGGVDRPVTGGQRDVPRSGRLAETFEGAVGSPRTRERGHARAGGHGDDRGDQDRRAEPASLAAHPQPDGRHSLSLIGSVVYRCPPSNHRGGVIRLV
jgi:hypothetical protein